ncbi:MAG: SRPBCC domain-containing protein [Candidatus Dormiibacterota bacterium]
MPDDNYEVFLSRHFDAPPEMVYQAFTDPDQLAQWFAPLVFHVPRATVDIDARAGGHWRITMVNNDNPEWRAPIKATFSEVVENRRLVGYEIADGFPGVADGTKMTLTIEFIPEGEGTRLELRQGPFPEQVRDMSATGWGQSLHKLAALLETPAQFRYSAAS